MILFSTPSSSSSPTMGVQSVISGSGIAVDNSNPQNPVISNNGVIEPYIQDYNGRRVSIDYSAGYPNYPTFVFDSVPFGNYFSTSDQFAIGNSTPTQVSFVPYDQTSSEIVLSGANNDFALNANGLYKLDFSLRIAASNTPMSPYTFEAALNIDGSFNSASVASITLPSQGYYLMNLSWQINVFNSSVIQLWFQVSDAANVYLATQPSSFSGLMSSVNAVITKCC